MFFGVVFSRFFLVLICWFIFVMSFDFLFLCRCVRRVIFFCFVVFLGKFGVLLVVVLILENCVFMFNFWLYLLFLF